MLAAQPTGSYPMGMPTSYGPMPPQQPSQMGPPSMMRAVWDPYEVPHYPPRHSLVAPSQLTYMVASGLSIPSGSAAASPPERYQQ